MSKEPVKMWQSRRGLGLGVAAAVAGALAGTVLYLHDGGTGKSAATPAAPAATAATGGLAALATGEVAAFVSRAEPAEIAPITFTDSAGASHKLADWHGKIVLVNIWATWCAPCRHEMPALDALKNSFAAADFDVVAIATDTSGMDKPRKFWTETGIKSLALYLDGSDATHKLGVIGMPTTLLLGRDGREIGRMVGPAEWASAEAKALIAAAIKLN